MEAARVNQNSNVVGRKPKTMNSKTLKCSVELWGAAELGDTSLFYHWE